MPKKRLSERERKRVTTRRLRHGSDFDRINARQAGLNSPTKFTAGKQGTGSGSRAAKIRWARYRQEKARKLKEGEE